MNNKDKRPPFVSYVRVRHTGLSPYKSNLGMKVKNTKITSKTEPLSNKNVELPNKFTIQKPTKKDPLQRKKGKENDQQVPDLGSNKVQKTAQEVLKQRNPKNEYENPTPTPSSEEETTPNALYEFRTKPNSVEYCQDSSQIFYSQTPTSEASGDCISHNLDTQDGNNSDTNEGEVILGTSFIHENNDCLNANTTCSVEPECQSYSSSNNVTSNDIDPSSEVHEKNANAEVGEQDSVESFHRTRLNSEIERLSEKANTWERLQENVNLPISVLDEVDSTVGQTRLLLRSKFKQFENLINTYSTGCLRPEDLVGFWEMMYLQVTQLDDKFSKLEQLEKNNWLENEENCKQTRKRSKRGGRKRKNKFNHIQSRFRQAKALQEMKINEELDEFESVKNDNGNIVIQTPSKAHQEEKFDGEIESILRTEGIKTPLINKNIMAAKLSRRSSTGIIIRQSLLGKLL
ncbi:disks large-associated protein 5-like isoform X2 [Cimex lectularius]|uniref:Disks large-associated protein 5 n=1 Tax=Cimex lectularius TaxID=79782 RepID=A0A8I6RWQ4_CIMLE|nr:disks large-associated protein 5-like isoform X2 [Cimex lectularius]